jgi:hypothetical protein
MLQSRWYRCGDGELSATLRRSCQDAQNTFTLARDSSFAGNHVTVAAS